MSKTHATASILGIRGSRVLFLASILAMACCFLSCRDGKAFFGEKTITIIVPHGPGGMDSYARALAPYLQKELPGSKVVVENVPAQGGIAGRNQVYEANPDGLTLGLTTGAGGILAEWAGQPGIRYHAADFSYIGRLSAEAHVLAAFPGAGIHSFGDILKRRSLVMGFPGISSDDYSIAMATFALVGLSVDAHPNYAGAHETSLACVKGQVEAVLFSESTIRPQILAGSLVPVASFGETIPGMGVIPSVLDSVPQELTSSIRALGELYALERVLFGPPHLPESRLAALRKAFDGAVADPDFLRDMKDLGRPLNSLSGADTTKLLAGIMSFESSIRPFLAAVAKKGE